MKGSPDQSTSLSGASQNTRLIDKNEEGTSDSEVEKVARKILSKHLKAFEKLAKGKTDE